MSALSIGSSAFPTRLQPVDGEPSAPTREDGLTAIVKWVPGEVIGAYAALVLALTGSANDPRAVTGVQWLWAFGAAALVLALVGGALEWRRQNPGAEGIPGAKKVELVARGLLATGAFLLWSLVVPGSASSQTWSWGHANAKVLPIVVPFAAVVFGLVAEYTVLPGTIGVILRLPRYRVAADQAPVVDPAPVPAPDPVPDVVPVPEVALPVQTSLTLPAEPDPATSVTLPTHPDTTIVLPDDPPGGPNLS